MKLYAKIKSERGKPLGKGGNKQLDIELLSGSVECPRVEYLLNFTEEGLKVEASGGIILDTGKMQGECEKKP